MSGGAVRSGSVASSDPTASSNSPTTPARVACVDVGTNTVLMLIVEADPSRPAGEPRVLADRAQITRLGQGLDRSTRLDPEASARTLAVLTDYGAQARSLGASVRAVGTAALRRAENGQQFLAAAAERLGAELEVISGDREARLSFAAVMGSFPALRTGPVVVIDIGGGSTELIHGRDGLLGSAVSYEVGSVRLTERCLRNDPPTGFELVSLLAAVKSALGGEPRAEPGARLVGVAGTVTTLLAVRDRLAVYDPARVHGGTLSRADVETLLDRLAALPLEERRNLPGLEPLRADVIVAGAAILRGALDQLGLDQLIVSDRGVRWGLAYEALGSARG